MPKEPAPRDKHKARMIETAVRILESEGLPALQARRIALDCGCSVGTLYNMFEGLDDLIVQANARTLERLRTALVDRVEDEPAADTTRRLMSVALAYLAFALENPLPWRALFEHRPADQWIPPTWYRESQAELYAIVETVLSDSMCSAPERRRCARAIFAAIHGIVALALGRKMGNPDVADLEAQIRFVVAATADGLRHLNAATAEI